MIIHNAPAAIAIPNYVFPLDLPGAEMGTLTIDGVQEDAQSPVRPMTLLSGTKSKLWLPPAAVHVYPFESQPETSWHIHWWKITSPLRHIFVQKSRAKLHLDIDYEPISFVTVWYSPETRTACCIQRECNTWFTKWIYCDKAENKPDHPTASECLYIPSVRDSARHYTEWAAWMEATRKVHPGAYVLPWEIVKKILYAEFAA